MTPWDVARARAVARGVCVRCGKAHPESPCPVVAEQWAARKARSQARGRCARCGDPSTTLECRRCQVDRGEDQADRRIARQVKGRCRCGREPLTGKGQCERCDRQNRRAVNKAAEGESK